MPKNIIYAFHNDLIKLPLNKILPTRKVDKKQEQSVKFQSILASIREIGIIEPLVVYPEDTDYILLDGHLRLHALQLLTHTETLCLISTDDESFTYNKQINRLSTIQEHKMLMKVIERGVSIELIAKTLNINMDTLKVRISMLNGITQEVIHKLGEKQINKDIFRILRKMKPKRQIEVVDMMIASNKYSVVYVNMMLLASQSDELIEVKKTSSSNPALELAIMEKEMSRLKKNYKVSEEKLAELKLGLIVAKGYLGKLLDNKIILEFMVNEQPDIHQALQQIYKNSE